MCVYIQITSPLRRPRNRKSPITTSILGTLDSHYSPIPGPFEARADSSIGANKNHMSLP